MSYYPYRMQNKCLRLSDVFGSVFKKDRWNVPVLPRAWVWDYGFLREGLNPWALFGLGQWNGNRQPWICVIVFPLPFLNLKSSFNYLFFSSPRSFYLPGMWLKETSRARSLLQLSTAKWHMNLMNFPIWLYSKYFMASLSTFFCLNFGSEITKYYSWGLIIAL